MENKTEEVEPQEEETSLMDEYQEKINKLKKFKWNQLSDEELLEIVIKCPKFNQEQSEIKKVETEQKIEIEKKVGRKSGYEKEMEEAENTDKQEEIKKEIEEHDKIIEESQPENEEEKHETQNGTRCETQEKKAPLPLVQEPKNKIEEIIEEKYPQYLEKRIQPDVQHIQPQQVQFFPQQKILNESEISIVEELNKIKTELEKHKIKCKERSNKVKERFLTVTSQFEQKKQELQQQQENKNQIQEYLSKYMAEEKWNNTVENELLSKKMF